MTLAELSRTLFAPVAIGLFVAAMLAYFYAMAAGVDPDAASAEDGGTAVVGRGGRASRGVATGLALLGVAALVAHVLTRWAASGRAPLGNMFEFSTVIALTVAVGGLVVVQARMRRIELMGFLMLGTVLTMASAILLYSEPGPLMPILDSWWRAIHVTAIVFAAGVFTLGFVFTALYLLRDRAERRVAEATDDRAVGSTVGAAYAGVDERIPDRVEPDAVTAAERADHRRELRRAIDPWRLAIGVWLVTGTISWVFQDPARFVATNTVMAASALLAWWAVPFLPDAATLDRLAYRTTAFAFPIWTFAVIAGAVWAEQSWGRYWGWDPKETSAFLTWVAYAGYLHARATRGWRGRNAAWLGVAAFWVLMFTYLAVNLVVTGLHSYGGLPT